jgi:hypothetical protein
VTSEVPQHDRDADAATGHAWLVAASGWNHDDSDSAATRQRMRYAFAHEAILAMEPGC